MTNNKTPNENKCVICGDITRTQSLKEVICDDNNYKRVINQAKILIKLGHNKGDVFCKDCFWK
jgi:hypothetical protein